MKKVLLFLFSLFYICFCSLTAFSENFYINDYNVNINVTDNGDMDIIEIIDTYFTKPCHGIIRSIPFIYELNYRDGEKVKSSALISDIAVNKQYVGYISDDNYNLKIGNPDKLIEGKQKYIITYKFKPKHYKKGNEDEFYYNVIGTAWSVPIKKSSFKITMPKDYDKNKVGVSIGKSGTIGFNGDTKIYSDGKNIFGTVHRQLEPYEGITVRIPLGENYYEK